MDTNNKMYATKFLKSEEDVKNQWLKIITNDKKTPLDVASKAVLDIKKEYYPFYAFEIEMETDWEACSIWYGTESERVPRTRIVYQDYLGNEYSRYDVDIEKRSDGRNYQRPRVPVERSWVDTVTRKVVDKSEHVSGRVEPTYYYRNIWASKGENFVRWATFYYDNDDDKSFIPFLDTDRMIEIDTSIFDKYARIPETVTLEKAEALAKEAVIEDMDCDEEIMESIPGDNFEDYEYDCNVIRCDSILMFLSVYHIYYEYNGVTYEGFISGSNREEDFYFEEMPVDTAKERYIDSLNKDIQANVFTAHYILAAVIGGLVSVCLIVYYSVFFGDSEWEYWRWWGASIISIVASIRALYKWVSPAAKEDAAQELLKRYNEAYDNTRKRICDASGNDKLTYEDKYKEIDGSIIDFEAKVRGDKDYFSNSFRRMKFWLSSRRRINRYFGSVTIYFLSIGIVVSIGSPIYNIIREKSYQNAVLMLANGEYFEGISILNKYKGYKDSSNIIKQYSKLYGISDDVYLKGLELINVFSSDAFNKEVGEAAKAEIIKAFSTDQYVYDNTELYVNTLTNMEIFKKHLSEIDALREYNTNTHQDRNSRDTLYINAIEGYYRLSCDHAIAQYIEGEESTLLFRYCLIVNNVKDISSLKKYLKECKSFFYGESYLSSIETKMQDIYDYGLITVVGEY